MEASPCGQLVENPTDRKLAPETDFWIFLARCFSSQTFLLSLTFSWCFLVSSFGSSCSFYQFTMRDHLPTFSFSLSPMPQNLRATHITIQERLQEKREMFTCISLDEMCIFTPTSPVRENALFILTDCHNTSLVLSALLFLVLSTICSPYVNLFYSFNIHLSRLP